MISVQFLAILSLVVLSTFDSVVIPYLRLSVADISIIGVLFALGVSKQGMHRSIYYLIIGVGIFFIVNSIVYLTHTILHEETFELRQLFRGILRPVLFIFLAINLYYSLRKCNIDGRRLYAALSIGGGLLTIIVLTQYTGHWPAQYHNNPAFSESGRWTFFNEGWRPTGLSNEASFVGIFLVLILSLQIYLKENIALGKSKLLAIAPYITLIGCFLTTSRIAFLIGVFLLIIHMRLGYKLLFISIAILFILFFENFVPVRILALGSFDGDASTLVRYGSNLAFINAILSGNYILGVGYLNGSNVAMQYANPAVLEAHGDLILPAFSVPLQLMLELGLPLFFLALFILIYKRKCIFTLPIITVMLASLVTGIQNFVFVYIFISLAVYAKHSLCR